MPKILRVNSGVLPAFIGQGITFYCIVKEGWILLILDTLTCQHGDKNHTLDFEVNLTPSTTFSYITALQILWVPLDYHDPFHPPNPFELFNFIVCRTVFYILTDKYLEILL